MVLCQTTGVKGRTCSSVVRLKKEAIEPRFVALSRIDFSDEIELLRSVVISSEGCSSHGKQWQNEVGEEHDDLCLGLCVCVQYVDDAKCELCAGG